MAPELISRVCGVPTSRRASASSALRSLITGPARVGRVTGVVRTAVYVVLAPVGGSAVEAVVALESRDGLGLPCAVVVPERAAQAPFAGVRVGDAARVGGGQLRAGPLDVAVMRWWAPRRARSGRRPGPAGPVVRAIGGLLPALEPAVAEAAGPLRGWLWDDTVEAGGPRGRDAVGRLVGLGSGLTPAGDDVLVGALVALDALDRDRAGALATAVRSVAPARRTTALSAALLDYAAAGAALPALVDVVDALAGPPPTDLGERVGRLLAVGHSSGAALAHGVALAATTTGAISEVG